MLMNAEPPPSARGSGPERTREDRELFVQYHRDGDARAREQLVERFLPLARQLARRYQRAGEPLDDLLQVASLGLIKAIDRFDPDREIAFSSYAVPTILGEIKRYFRDRTWAVRVPRDLQELTLKVDRAVGELSDSLRRQPSVGEIAAAVGVDEEEVLEALQAGGAYRAVSFDAPRTGGDEDVATLGDSVGIDEHGFDRAEERATLAQLMTTVTPRERSGPDPRGDGGGFAFMSMPGCRSGTAGMEQRARGPLGGRSAGGLGRTLHAAGCTAACRA
jgi:RNA polymerase sigma-B factor